MELQDELHVMKKWWEDEHTKYGKTVDDDSRVLVRAYHLFRQQKINSLTEQNKILMEAVDIYAYSASCNTRPAREAKAKIETIKGGE